VIKRAFLPAIAFCLFSVPAFAQQQCLHDQANEAADQVARRRLALTATRTVNNIQYNRPDAGKRIFLRHDELAAAPFAAKMKDPGSISLQPNTDIVPGFRLTLDVTTTGYWFSVKDTTDPCGFAYISNDSGLIYTAQPIR
jgi:hypothetical protein